MAAIGRALRSFGRFWWDFIVGEDVSIAIAVVVGLGAVAGLHAAKVPAWWSLPLVWAVVVAWSVSRVTKRT